MQKLRKRWRTVRWRWYWRAYVSITRSRYYWQCWRRQFPTIFL